MAKGRTHVFDPVVVTGRGAGAHVTRYVFEPVEVIAELPAQEATQGVVDAWVVGPAQSAVDLPAAPGSPMSAHPKEPDPTRTSLAGREAVETMSDTELSGAIERTEEARDNTGDVGLLEQLTRNLGILFSERIGRGRRRVVRGFPIADDVVADLMDAGLSWSDLDGQAQQDVRELVTGMAFVPAEGPESQAESNARKVRAYAVGLLEVQLKLDQLTSVPAGQNVAEQRRILSEHIDQVATRIRKASEEGVVDLGASQSIKVGIDAGGLAADLMFLDRLGVDVGMSRITRAGANRGLAWAWKAMRMLATDPGWTVTREEEADESIRNAAAHRDTLVDLLRIAGVMKAGVTAAQIMDFAVSAPRLLATGKTLLQGLAKWLTESGPGGMGMLRVGLGAGGTGTLTLMSGGRALVLTAAEVEALVAAGVLSSKALALYMLAKGGGSAGVAPGPHGERPPGSKSRYSDEEIAREYLREVGKRVPQGERGLEELGVIARRLRTLRERHHLLVQQLRRWFEERGINIDRYTVKLTADEHRWIHNEYRWNELWKDFRLKNPNATEGEILAHMRKLMKRVGLQGLDIVPYR